MAKVKKRDGFVHIDGHPPMNREQYEKYRAKQKKDGDSNWPPYEEIPDDDPLPSP
jgi:hypothetical protein